MTGSDSIGFTINNNSLDLIKAGREVCCSLQGHGQRGVHTGSQRGVDHRHQRRDAPQQGQVLTHRSWDCYNQKSPVQPVSESDEKRQCKRGWQKSKTASHKSP